MGHKKKLTKEESIKQLYGIIDSLETIGKRLEKDEMNQAILNIELEKMSKFLNENHFIENFNLEFEEFFRQYTRLQILFDTEIQGMAMAMISYMNRHINADKKVYTEKRKSFLIAFENITTLVQNLLSKKINRKDFAIKNHMKDFHGISNFMFFLDKIISSKFNNNLKLLLETILGDPKIEYVRLEIQEMIKSVLHKPYDVPDDLLNFTPITRLVEFDKYLWNISLVLSQLARHIEEKKFKLDKKQNPKK